MALGLAMYTIQIYPKRQRLIPPTKLGGEIDIWTWVQSYLHDRKDRLVMVPKPGQPEGLEEARTLKITGVEHGEEGRWHRGLADCGVQGLAGTIRDTQTGDDAYAKRRQDSDMTPMYFRFQVPDGASRAVLIVETRGSITPKPALDHDLRRFMDADEMSCRIGTLTHRDAFELYMTGATVQDIRVVAHKENRDSRRLLSNTTIGNSEVPDGSRIEVRIVQPSMTATVKKKLVKAAGNKGQVKELVEVYGLSDYDEAKITVKTDKGPRVVNLMKPQDTRFTFDITSDVDYDPETRLPVFDSIDAEARRLYDEFKYVLLQKG